MPTPETGSVFSRGGNAAPARTLVDILAQTVREHTDATAIDDGNSALTYGQLAGVVGRLADRLAAAGVAPGDRVGIRIPSGTVELYVSILSVLSVGAAYVPVDHDDPDERARLVFDEAAVVVELGAAAEIQRRRPKDSVRPANGTRSKDKAKSKANNSGRTPRRAPLPGDDAWIIFTSGSTGVPKGVAVSHRSAAALVDAEADLFLRERPLGSGDRVLAGLSVAFDASCEEMWLAWRHGACLVPAPRALVRSGIDLGPWLVDQQITAISTVPTLASLWPAAALSRVRLLIFGGEACPPELADRLAIDGREVWNTYGPTETTVVACAARLGGPGPVRIGLPLEGWDLAVVGPDGQPVAEGEVGELVIGGVGLARYLDPAKDAEKFAPMPTLGWERAYRSGDLVRLEQAGLLFVGRADDQVKLGGRRIELGEVDSALLALQGVAGAAAAVRTSGAGNQVLVGYLAMAPGAVLDLPAAQRRLREVLPAALVPLLAEVEEIPARTSGKVDRDALPWPLPGREVATGPVAHFTGTAQWLAEQWTEVLGSSAGSLEDDFFSHGGGSLSAARLVSTLRARFPEVTVADVYENPRLGTLADTLDEFSPAVSPVHRAVAPSPRRARVAQELAQLPLATVVGLRWVVWLAAANNVLGRTGAVSWAPTVSWWWVLAGWLLFISPPGRMAVAVAGARLLLRGVKPGTYPRGGGVHLRLWCAESVARAAGAENLSGAPWITLYARALGAKVAADVDLHALPPVTGLLSLGQGCSVESEVDLSGHWLDGDVLRVGRVRVGAGATVGSRSTLLPGARVGQDAEVAAGSAVSGAVPPGERWGGSPAQRLGVARHRWPGRRPRRGPMWVPVFGLTAGLLGAFPVLAAAAGLAVIGRAVYDDARLTDAVHSALFAVPLATLVSFAVLTLLTVLGARLLGFGLRPGFHAVRGRIGWQVWATERLIDEARTYLFPLYASLATPSWLRALGATVGRGVEASTVLLLPKMTTIGDEAFLADDTMIGSYELGGGWLRIKPAKIGKRAFLGNSGMTAPGRAVPKRGLVAVLSATPKNAKAGTSWLGNPPVQLRREAQHGDQSRTFAPPLRLRVARGAVELCRLVPVMVTFGLGVGVLLALEAVLERSGWVVAGLLSGIVLLLAGVVAAVVSTLAKWLLVGKFRTVEHPLWSSFVWRNELADTFIEMVAVPWFAQAADGTAALNLWLRSLGASIGRGVWCETYWLPEADLVRLGDGASVNRGCVLQTHLFHDRIMSMDTVTLEAGATLGPHSVILPAASIGAASTVGPASLVLRGERIPPGTRWAGNPTATWPVRAGGS
jgi:non-ribosomal peptide synthetase-like protein